VLDHKTSIENRSGCYEKPDVPLEVIRSDCNQESSLLTGHQNSASARNVYNSTTSSLGSEFNQLLARLQALESEKEYTKEAILALRKENEELKSLQEIALHLQYLKKTVQDSKLRKEDSSFFSLLKVLYIVFHNCKNQYI
jgi:predicted ribosome quality control (RQC) complex YloA/Tae2 family protein